MKLHLRLGNVAILALALAILSTGLIRSLHPHTRRLNLEPEMTRRMQWGNATRRQQYLMRQRSYLRFVELPDLS